jgi:hypothetical protein
MRLQGCRRDRDDGRRSDLLKQSRCRLGRRTVKPEIREKLRPDGVHALRLTCSILGLDYSEEFAVVDRAQALFDSVPAPSNH